jgi:WD40 repeat protein
VATASEDETVRLWNPITGLNTATLPAEAGQLTTLTWSPDGTRLATASFKSEVRLWDRTGHRITTLGDSGNVSAVAWSPDGTRLATASARFSGTDEPNEYEVRLWATNTLLKPLQRLARRLSATTLVGHTALVTTLAWSPDGTCLATGDDHNDAVRLWDAATGLTTATLSGHISRANAIAWSPDGTQLATVGGDRKVRLWNPATGLITATLPGHTNWKPAVTWSPSGRLLAATSDDQTVQLWNVTTGSTAALLAGHTAQVSAVAWSPDGTRLVSADYDGTAIVWNSKGSECASVTIQPVRCLAWSRSKIAAGQWGTPAFIDLRAPRS